MRTACLAALLAYAGCAPAEIGSCADPLAGIWADDESRRYHLVANRGGYEMYALFDTTTPPDGTPKATSPIIYAPIVYDFQPNGDIYTGSRTQRQTRGAIICAPRTDARIVRCHGDRIELEIERAGTLDWQTCERGPSPLARTSAGTESLVLHRERAAR